MEEVLAQLTAAQRELEPNFKALKTAVAALNTALKLASENKADALPMHKALLKLEATATIQQLNLPQFQAQYRAATITTMPPIFEQLALLAQ